MRRLVYVIILMALLLAPTNGSLSRALAGPAVQPGPVSELMAAMSPAQKVAQLFIVSFYGSSAARGTDIYNLITEHHVGGVILSADYDNITDTVNAPGQVLALANELQSAAITASQTLSPTEDSQVPAPQLPPFVPLLIAIDHEGNGFPHTEVRSGVTDLPSPMAIGATWDRTQAESMGRIAGTELAAMGINLLLGPSLDVLENPDEAGRDLGTRVFGGDPYWVGVMGEAYIRGVHFGSEDQVAVIAKHFPGHGGSDRRPDQEVPTVRKTSEELISFDLVPFRAVTSDRRTEATADGLLTAHLRFQGVQGNIRQNTKPLSLDPEALADLLALDGIAAWRANGGVTLSDSLGVRAVKQFYDASLQQFNNRVIVRDAFNAGNDLLLLTEFGLDPRRDQVGRIIDTLTYFEQQYKTDPNFAALVDAAVARILALKLRLSGGQFNPEAVLRPAAGLDVLRRDEDDVAVLAQDAASLISPAFDELEARAPEPPLRTERIVFFTDLRFGQQCSNCQRYPLMGTRQLEEVVVQLYGPTGTGQVRATNLQSFTFEDLALYLNSPPPAPANAETPTPPAPAVEAALNQADWIVFSLLEVSPDFPASTVLATFLRERSNLVRNKKVVAFSFSAPYYLLDATDLTKLTAYYSLYSYGPAFVTTAARLLFRELVPRGAPPVSVPSIDYQLFEITRPNPNISIDLFYEKVGPILGGTPETALRQGDTINVRTGVIVDHNGNVVPDGTVVTFLVSRRLLEEEILEVFNVTPATITNGVASTDIELDRPGDLEVRAESEPAKSSTLLRLQVRTEGVSITREVPTPNPTSTPPPTDTPVPPTATATVDPTPTQVPNEPEDRVDWRGFLMMCLGLAVTLVGGYRLGTVNGSTARQGIRVALAGAIGMLAGYNYYALGLPGSNWFYGGLDLLAAPACAVVGALVGLAVGWYWFVWRHEH